MKAPTDAIPWQPRPDTDTRSHQVGYSSTLDLSDDSDPPAALRIAMRDKAIIIIDLFTMHTVA